MTADGVQLIPGAAVPQRPRSSARSPALLTGSHVVRDAAVRRRARALAADRAPPRRLAVPRADDDAAHLAAARGGARRATTCRRCASSWHMAAPCPPWLKEAWIDWLGPERILELYGGTEAQAVTVITGTEWLEHRGLGRPAGPRRDRRSSTPTATPLPPGEVGEIWMRRGPGEPPTYRYIGAEAGDAAAAGSRSATWAGSTRTATSTSADRRTDMILVGGANVYPAEVEAALDEHPGVRSCVRHRPARRRPRPACRTRSSRRPTAGRRRRDLLRAPARAPRAVQAAAHLRVRRRAAARRRRQGPPLRAARGAPVRRRGLLAALVALIVAAPAEAALKIEVTSNRADLVSGGDALVRITPAAGARVTVGGARRHRRVRASRRRPPSRASSTASARAATS